MQAAQAGVVEVDMWTIKVRYRPPDCRERHQGSEDGYFNVCGERFCCGGRRPEAEASSGREDYSGGLKRLRKKPEGMGR